MTRIDLRLFVCRLCLEAVTEQNQEELSRVNEDAIQENWRLH